MIAINKHNKKKMQQQKKFKFLLFSSIENSKHKPKTKQTQWNFVACEIFCFTKISYTKSETAAADVTEADK